MEKKTIRVDVPEKVIKATFYEKNTYVASDGSEFSSEMECIYHEGLIKRLKTIAHIPHMDYNGYSTTTFDASYYYVLNEDDFNALQLFFKFGSDFTGHYNNPGWYKLDFHDGGDYRDDYLLYGLSGITNDLDELNKQLASKLAE